MDTGFLVPIESRRAATIVSFELGQDGIRYAKSVMKEAGPLAVSVAAAFGDQGVSFAALEQGVDFARARDFQTGTSMPTFAIRKWLAENLTSRWGNDVQLVFEDAWMKPEDIQPDLPYFLIAETSYYVPSGGDLSDRIWEGQRRVMTWPFSAFVVAPSVALPRFGERVDQDCYNRLVHNTQEVLVSAYDHEGYVVWRKFGST